MLLERSTGSDSSAPLDAAIDSLAALLESLDPEARARADGRLRALVAAAPAAAGDDAVERIQAASAEEILAIVNNDMGAQ
jgi:hypothetical protein